MPIPCGKSSARKCAARERLRESLIAARSTGRAVRACGHRRRLDQLKPEFLALNPAGVVPVLVDGEQVLTESRIINEYLEDAYPQPRPCPEGAHARARMRLWTRYADEEATEAVKLPTFVMNIQPELRRMPREEALAAIERIPHPKTGHITCYRTGQVIYYRHGRSRSLTESSISNTIN